MKNNLKHGIGVENYPDGSVYTGEYCGGQKSGKGKYILLDGSSYEG